MVSLAGLEPAQSPRPQRGDFTSLPTATVLAPPGGIEPARRRLRRPCPSQRRGYMVYRVGVEPTTFGLRVRGSDH